MPLFISMLLTVGAAYWYYRTAERMGAMPIHWGLAGAIAYQLPAWIWMIMVSRPYLSGMRGAEKTGTAAFLIGHSWIVVGAVCALLIYQFVLLRTKIRSH
ncbi:MAG: hypothetical protein U1E83_05570 [Methylotetracoccus sp.]